MAASCFAPVSGRRWLTRAGCTPARLALLGLLVGQAVGCLPEFPARSLADAGGRPDGGESSDGGGRRDGGAPVDGGAPIDGGGQGDAGSGCMTDEDCPAPASCRRGACFSSCLADQDCTRAGTHCFLERCVGCTADDQCQAGQYCLEGVCRGYCRGTVGCPRNLTCQEVQAGVKLCLCAGDGDCPVETRCVEGRCVPPCDAPGSGGCGDELGRQCVSGQCYPKTCSSLADPACGQDFEHSCLLVSAVLPENGGRGTCSRTCRQTDRGDGDDCGIGFRCHALGTLAACLPAGNTPLGESCIGTEGYSLACLGGWCVERKCTVLCDPLAQGRDCRTLFGSTATCVQPNADVSWGWFCAMP